MGYEIVRGPFMLLETVAMIYKYVNKISFLADNNRQRFFMDSATFAARESKMKRLQEIMEDVCRDLDAEDPDLLRYFAGGGTDQDQMCIAQLMTYAFCTLREPGFSDNVREICQLWHTLQQQGYWIKSEEKTDCTFMFTKEPGCPGDLYKQIKALSFPCEFRMEIYDVFRDFERSMWEMAGLIEPLARRLEEIYRAENWMFEEAENYWDETFRSKSPRDFVAAFANESLVRQMSDTTTVGISLMDSHLLMLEVATSPLGQGRNILYVGSAIPSNGLPRNRGGNLENVGNMLKCIGDKKRLEILQRLNREPQFGGELAESMGMDPGHTSRILTQMHAYGFLQEEKDRLRLYYRPDREVIHNFLELVEATIFSQ
ncbi:MAG: winged helix-turn-helix transcriptional regulator [Oscillospiraceae bacterium]|nr:winged helix-turn-helix transcriptional regulator [Oscillospiraceae bacterium]